MKEFEQYKSEKTSECPPAVRAPGLPKMLRSARLRPIIAIGKKLPAGAIEEDDKLLRYYDRAQLHLEGLKSQMCKKLSNAKGV